MVLQFERRLASGQSALDRDVRDLYLVAGDEGTFLYAGTGRNGGVSVYHIAPGSDARLVDTAYFSGLPTGITGTRISTLAGDDALVLLACTSDGELAYFNLEADFGLGTMRAVDAPASGIADWTTSGDGQLFAVDRDTGVISFYEVAEQGMMQVASAMEAVPEGSLLTAVPSASGPVLVLAEGGAGLSELVSYRMQADRGVLEVVDRAGGSEGLWLATPSAIETITAYDASWVIVAAAGSNSLSVLRVSPGGHLTPTDHVLDTLDTRFSAAPAVATINVQGQVFVFAGGADDGLSVFTLLPTGHLVHRQSIAHELGWGLDDVIAIAATLIGEAVRIFVTSEGSPGVSQFSWSVSALGVVHSGQASVVQGTEKDDVLLAPQTGTTTLDGGAGDDILVSATGAATLKGGAGADIFVLSATDAPLHIVDFEPGLDQLDLSMLPMLRSPAQLTATPLADGIQLAFQSFQVVVSNANGTRLELTDIWASGRFTLPDRLLVDAIPEPQVVVGSDASEQFNGADGRDTILAAGGDDTLWGASGADSLDGGFGDDQLWGAAGDDTVLGDWGHDTIGAGAGADSILAGGGDDLVWSGSGNDTVNGGQGQDVLSGDVGDDVVNGGDDADSLDGGFGNDQLWGGGGDDTVLGDWGHDTIGAGAGADSILAGGGNDLVWSGSDDDTISGGDGDDALWAIDGDDIVWGGDGNDRLGGGAGNDNITGGVGDDVVYGGAGNDSLAGYTGADTIWAGLGSDNIWGGAGADHMDGGPGQDSLTGGADDDLLWGATGADVFIFSDGHGQDRIMDFEPGLDHILFTGGIEFPDLTLREHVDGTEIVSDFGAIVLHGIMPGQLSADDFLFN